MKIIDRTLTVLGKQISDRKLLLELCEKLKHCGIDFIELSVPVLQTIGFESLPEGVDYILHISSPKEKNSYPYFRKYSCRYTGEDDYDKILAEFQINDIREIKNLKTFENSKLEARITGLDDVILHDYSLYFEILKNTFNNKLDVCAQNEYGCATAIATEWILSGGKSVSASYAGVGGYAPLEEVIVALRVKARRKPNKNLQSLCELKRIYTKITSNSIDKKKPILGDDIFKIEAGIHADGISKNPLTYEPYDPQIVGGKRSVVIGKHSGAKAVELKLSEYNLRASNNGLRIFLAAAQAESIKLGRSLTDEEFLRLVKEVAAHEKEKVSD